MLVAAGRSKGSWMEGIMKEGQADDRTQMSDSSQPTLPKSRYQETGTSV
jgi:hypothetical protein